VVPSWQQKEVDRLRKAKYTPLVNEADPDWNYSPPPAMGSSSTTLYFSIILPFAKTRCVED
jgi:hypothetical protein